MFTREQILGLRSAKPSLKSENGYPSMKRAKTLDKDGIM